MNAQKGREGAVNPGQLHRQHTFRHGVVLNRPIGCHREYRGEQIK